MIHIFHKWDRWSEEYRKLYFRTYLNGEKIPNSEFTKCFQSRVCKKCGKIDIRAIEDNF